MPKKATECKECENRLGNERRGKYCLPCWRKHEVLLRGGFAESYTPRKIFEVAMPCPECGRPIMEKHPNYTLCKPCGTRKASERVKQWRISKERAKGKPKVKRACKTLGCQNLVPTQYSRYCTEHAPAARRAIVDRVRDTVPPIVGQKAKAERERLEFVKPAPVVIPPHIRVKVCPPVAPTFRDFTSGEDARPYQRRH